MRTAERTRVIAHQVESLDRARREKKRGLKPGQRHSGQFKKGFDERRYIPTPGRAELRRTVEEVFSEEGSVEAMRDYLLGIIEDNQTPAKVRLNAIQEFLDRGCGRPVDRLAIAEVGRTKDPKQMSLRELQEHFMHEWDLSPSEVKARLENHKAGALTLEGETTEITDACNFSDREID